MISVVVPTRNRPDHTVPCANAILANPAVSELVLVDQSDTADTERAAATIRDSRLRYSRSDLRGCSHARNTGIQVASGALLAFTDDDCRVASDWAERMIGAFNQDPEAAIVCGRVRVPDGAWARGFAASFDPRTPTWQGTFGDWGITANLGVRREVIDRIGGFDAMLGVGSPLRSGGEPDLLYRALRAGLKVANAPDAVVEHLGVRPRGRDSRHLLRSYGIGTGAAIFKHVRLGDPVAVRTCLRWLLSALEWNWRSLLRTGRPSGLGYTVAFVAGWFLSLRFAVDPATRMYVSRQR